MVSPIDLTHALATYTVGLSAKKFPTLRVVLLKNYAVLIIFGTISFDTICH